MGFLKKKKSSQASPSQGGKHLSIISPANTLSSIYARSPSSATIDDSRNDVGSDGRSVANNSIADVNITASKATMRHTNITVNTNNKTSAINNINTAVASPLSTTSGAGKEVRDKPSSAAAVTTPSAVVAAAACPTIVMPPLLVPQSQPTAYAKKKTTKEEKQKCHQQQPPNKSEKHKQVPASKRGDKELNKMRRGGLSEVGSSYSSQSMSYDERETFSEHDDDYDDELTEESAMYTDDSSNSFVSLGYKTSHSESLAFSRTSSSENTDSASTTEKDDDEEREVNGPRQILFNRRDSNRFDPETESATPPANRSSKAKKALKQLNNLATKAKKESTSNTSRTPVKEKSISRAITPHKKVATASDSVVSAGASSKASVTTAMFIKSMEEYTVKNTENQLLLTVNERGNVQKLSLQVSAKLALLICIRIQASILIIFTQLFCNIIPGVRIHSQSKQVDRCCYKG